MELYQFYIELIPTRWLRDNDIAYLYNDVQKLDTYEAWELNQPKFDFEPMISKMLPKGPSWCSDIKIWGDEKESDVQVIREGSKIESISIRIDMRREVMPLLIDVLDLASEMKCQLLIPEVKTCIAPSLTEIKPFILGAASFEYCGNPEDFAECKTL
ncbi:MAG: hypothetical protein OCC49_01255 [Fibrobacterales bacterium]